MINKWLIKAKELRPIILCFGLIVSGFIVIFLYFVISRSLAQPFLAQKHKQWLSSGPSVASSPFPLSESGVLLYREGANLMEDIERVLDLLSENDDHYRVLEGMLRAQIRDRFALDTEDSAFKDLLTDTAYRFLVQKEGSTAGFAIQLNRSAHQHTELLDRLAHSFSAQFSPTSVRSRTVPSGAVVQDIVSDQHSVQETRSTVQGFSIRRLYHQEGGEVLLIATHRDRIVISDSDALFEVMLRMTQQPLEQRFFVSEEGLFRFVDRAPDSDILRFLQGMAQKDGGISLSSWSCFE